MTNDFRGVPAFFVEKCRSTSFNPEQPCEKTHWNSCILYERNARRMVSR